VSEHLRKIISGGQTGVDRGALDAAKNLGLDVGGWCPRGRRSEDGTIPAAYSFLKETASSGYPERTEKNVLDSDATLVLHPGTMGPGSRQTVTLAKRHKRPVVVVDMRDVAAGVAAARAFIDEAHPTVLNVAGPRGGATLVLQAEACAFLMRVLAP
jgi:hypothetical protein